MPNQSRFLSYLEHCQQRVNTALDKCLPEEDPPEHNLAEAIRYAVIGGGKRIRPVMVYAAGETMEVPPEVLDIPACAVEMIHAYSLIHDDLPAMDDDDLRRGKPTCHKAFDEATAILAGDALQALAYEILTDDKYSLLPTQHRIQMLQLLTKASGAYGMAGGQSVDLASVGKALSLEQLETMHRLKTGALIRASILLGAMCNPDINTDDLNTLDKYSTCIGLSFQIQDDILNLVGDRVKYGKEIGGDIWEGKRTLMLIHVSEACTREEQRRMRSFLSRPRLEREF